MQAQRGGEQSNPPAVNTPDNDLHMGRVGHYTDFVVGSWQGDLCFNVQAN